MPDAVVEPVLEPSGPWTDPDYVAAVTDLLGVVAYGELQAFHRIAADAGMAPDLEANAAVSAMAINEFAQFARLRDYMVSRGIDPVAAMAPFVRSIDEFHRSTAPSDWLEGLVKVYVGDGIADDFYAEISRFVDPETGELIRSVTSDRGQVEFVVYTVRDAMEQDPRVAGRLALWGRRLVGEAVSQAQRVAVDRDAMTHLLAGDSGADLAEISRLFARMTDNHTARMAALGLKA